MNASTIARYLIGDAKAIRAVATDRAALWTGIILVLLTGIARNYDQNYIFETPFWLVGPLFFSFFSGSFLYWILIKLFARQKRTAPTATRWPTFMGLFWMTAPIAWLYAIPVERFLDSYPAAQANLTLLAIVALWRVLLISRVASVLLEVHFLRALGWVLIAATLEVLIVFFFGAFFGGTFARSIMAGMGGMRNSPEENLILGTLSVVWFYTWGVLIATIIALNLWRYRGTTKPLPPPSSGKIPWLTLSTLTILWTAIAIPAQLEQHRFFTHAALLQNKNYPSALAYLAQHKPNDFPPGRRLEPNPYEYRVWEDLPPTIALLNSNSPPWIRNLYLSHLTATLSHHWPNYRSLTNVAAMYLTLEQLPEGRDWISTHQVVLAPHSIGYQHLDSDAPPTELTAKSNILATLRRIGVAETNLTKMRD